MLGILLFTCITAHDDYIANKEEIWKEIYDNFNVSIEMFLNFINMFIRFFRNFKENTRKMILS